MRLLNLEILKSFALGILILLVAVLLRIWISPMASGLPFLTLYPAMVLPFYLRGSGLGFSVTVFGIVTEYFLFIRGSEIYFPSFGLEISTAFFVLSAYSVNAIVRKISSLISLQRNDKEQYERILEDQADFIYRFRSDDTITYVNNAYCRFFGKSREEIIGHKWQALIFPDYVSMFNQHLHTLSPANPIVVIQGPVFAANDVLRWSEFVNKASYDKSGSLIEIQSVGRDITKQKQLEQALAASEKELRELAEAMPQIVWATRPDGWNIYFNNKWADYTGLTLEESYGHGWNKPFHPDDQIRAWDAWQNAINNNEPYCLECKLRRFDGQYRWWLVHGVPVLDQYGKIYKWFGTCTDIHDLKEIERELKIAATAFEANVGITVMDENTVILRINAALTKQTGYSSEDIVGKTSRLLQSDLHDPAFYDAMWKVINDTGSWQGEMCSHRKNGEIYPKLLVISAIKDNAGVTSRYVATESDISEQKAAEDEIRTLAFFDPLTGLPNRRLLTDRVHQALSSSTRSGKGAALMFIDLDKFKELNDTRSHEKGDLLLQQVARRLETKVRECDTVGRLGGDEFVVMLEGLSVNENEAAKQASDTSDEIIAALYEPYELAGETYHSTGSIGCTIIFGHKYSVDEVLQQADIAMYQAKSEKGNKCRFFNLQMQQAIDHRVALEDELRTALKLGQFCIYYQMQRDSSGNTLGAEALIRWRHPKRGLIQPSEFISFAEESQLIMEIDNWVLETACAQLNTWQENGLTSELILALNVSPRQFRQNNFADHVRLVMRRHQVKPHLLRLELTESMLLETTESTVSTMNSLKENGVQFSLDDFGTGYSSLQYLKRLPFNQLKIAGPFVRDIDVDDNGKTIVRTIISMAKNLNMDVIAEGVETESQHDFLLSNGCSQFQGYLFGIPLPITEFNARLAS